MKGDSVFSAACDLNILSSLLFTVCTVEGISQAESAQKRFNFINLHSNTCRSMNYWLVFFIRKKKGKNMKS